MSSKVFISCGQALPAERSAAKELSEWLSEQGFLPYVAIQAQSIQDVNMAIISELKASDYYIFIDFPRERLQGDPDCACRGSVFTHQEMAIAYTLGFEKVLFLRHEDVKLEGLLGYTASNALIFSSPQDAIQKAKQAIVERKWTATYTRHLAAVKLQWTPENTLYISHSTGEPLQGRFLRVDIQNNRPDLAAFNTVSRLNSLADAAGNTLPISDRSHLKATNQPGYTQTIWPQSYGQFDILLAKANLPATICLNSSLDLRPKPAIISQPGFYTLGFEVLSESFPVLTFSLHLYVDQDAGLTRAEFVSS